MTTTPASRPDGTAALIAPGFEAVAEEFTRAVAAEPGFGAQLAVYVHGAPVLRLAGGVTAAGDAVTPDTLHAIFSTSKGLGSLVVARLIQDGLLDPALPVAHYWPEFAAAGKDAVTVNQLLSHQAGLPGVEGGFTMEELLESRPAAARLAASAPRWNPGAAFGYHALTFGTLLEELVLRVSGRRAQELYEEWFRAPAGADAWLGLPGEQRGRYAELVPAGSGGGADGPLSYALSAVGGSVLGWFSPMVLALAVLCGWAGIALRRTRAHRPTWPWEDGEEG